MESIYPGRKDSVKDDKMQQHHACYIMCVCACPCILFWLCAFCTFRDTNTDMPVSVSACVKPAECEEATFQEAKAQTVKRWA